MGTQFTAINSIIGTEGDLINKSSQVLNFKRQYGKINENVLLINNKVIDNAEFLAKVKGVFLDKSMFLYLLLYKKLEF